jgi:hypothetical protein
MRTTWCEGAETPARPGGSGRRPVRIEQGVTGLRIR